MNGISEFVRAMFGAGALEGVRYTGDQQTRAFFFNEIENRLASYGAAYKIISGADWAARIARAIEIAEKMFAAQAIHKTPERNS